jgi:hypothetical protein
MRGKSASGWEGPVLMIGMVALGFVTALGAPARTAAQDRLWADQELVPPLRLVEEDFKKGFSRTYRFPCEGPPAGGHFNRCEGTIMLSYAPGKGPAAVHASINYREIYYRPGEAKDGRTVELGPYSYTVSWSGDLEPVDEDPEGKFPAQRFNMFGPDVRPVVRCDDPEIRVVPGSGTILVDLVLMQEIGGTIYRDTYIRIEAETAIKTWTQTFERWEDSFWHTWWMCGPPASQGEEEEKSLAIEGCTDLLKGGKGQVTAKTKSEGGKYTWSSESSSVLKVSGSGSSASVSAGSTGRGVVRVEYETGDGEKVEAEKAGSVVELRSVGPVPQIALIDDRGQSLPPVEVPLVQEPPEGDLLTFVVADPGVATILNLGTTLQIQGNREGSTTAQAQTSCGVKTGPVLKLEVVRCSRETVEKLRQELRMLQSRLASGRSQMAELTGNDEFNRADREGPQDIEDLAKSTAELISAAMGAASKVKIGMDAAGKARTAVSVSKGAERADSLWGMLNAANDMATGLASGDMDKVSGATFDATVQLLNLAAVGLVKTAYSAMSAASKVGQDLGTMFGTADRIRELEEATQGTLKELEDAERRLYKVCGAKSGSPSKEPPAEPPAKPAAAAKSEPSAKSASTTAEPTQPQTEPPAEPPGEEPPSSGAGEQPPDNPPGKPGGGGSTGLALKCGCDGWKYKSWGSSGAGLIKLSQDLQLAAHCTEEFQSEALAGIKDDLNRLQEALKELAGARSLASQQMQTRARGFLERTQGMSTRLEGFFKKTEEYRSFLEGCGRNTKEAADILRKSPEAVESGKAHRLPEVNSTERNP